jgi:hypothetical protein
MGRCDGTTTKTRGLNRQHGKEAVQGAEMTTKRLGFGLDVFVIRYTKGGTLMRRYSISVLCWIAAVCCAVCGLGFVHVAAGAPPKTTPSAEPL